MRLCLAILIVTASAAHADVIFEEPTRITCERSEVIVAGSVDGTTAAGPFTNAQPPTVKITAIACWKGCKPGDHLEVAQWADPKPSHSGKPGPSDAKAEQTVWKKSAVEPPAPATKVMLFLRHDGEQLVRVQDSGGYGGYVMLVGADDKQIQRSAGMCEVAIEISGDRDRTATAGKPVMVHVEVRNTSGTTAVFHAEAMTLKLQTDTQPGEDLSPAWTPPNAITLPPGAKQAYDWDLAKLFTGAFIKPGSYWLTLDAPGAMGLHWISIAVR